MTPAQFRVARRGLSDRVITALKRMFVLPGSWRPTDMARFVAQAVPLLEGGQLQLAALTALVIAEQASQATGTVVAPPGVPVRAAVNLRTGVDAREVYERPFVTVYTALSKGEVLPRAVRLGATRLGSIAELDLQTTYAHAARAAMRQLPPGVRPRSWRRVPVGPRNCAMCLLASTQRYHIENLNPIHGGCDCQVAQVFDADPGQVLDEDLLGRVHTAVAELTGQSDPGGRTPDYRGLLVSSTATHGELGELLVRPGDRFTGPADL